jgi:hypothetical protein
VQFRSIDLLTEFIKHSQKKHSAAQILSHKIFSFCEQTLKMGANDASVQGQQSALKKRHQNIFLRKITGIRSQVPAIFSENNEAVLGDFN